MDSSSTPPGSGSPEQPDSGMTSGSSDMGAEQSTPSTPWTPPTYSPSSGAPPTPPSGYRVEQSPSASSPSDPGQSGPPPGYVPPPQGAPTQPYGQPYGQTGQAYPQQPQGYPQQSYQPNQYPQQQPGQYPQQPGQYPQQQQQYAPPVGQSYAPQGYQQPQAAVPEKKSGVPTFVWVLIGIVVAIVLLCGGTALALGLLANSAGNAIKGGLNTVAATASAAAFDLALETGSYEEAYSYLGGDLAKNYSAAKLQQRWEALAGSENAFSISSRFGSPKDAGNNRTTIDWIISPPNGSSKTVVLTLDEGTNDWKIIAASPDLIPNP